MVQENQIPRFSDEFRSSIVDFTNDLTPTFPEYAHLWKKWSDLDTNEDEIQQLFEHCLKVYPERFFDILNQKTNIFEENGSISVEFLPGVDFKILFHGEGVSDKIRESIWKYLQIVLLIVVKSMQDKFNFGDAMKMFNDLNVDELQQQLEGVLGNITNFFEENKKTKTEEQGERDEESDSPKMPNIPKMDDLHDHLQTLFNGKIGKLAKELADDMGNDLAETLGKEMEGVTSTKDVLSKLMQNPETMGNVINSVKTKLTSKMESGEISKEDLMNEANEMMGKMKGLGGMGDIGKMFGNMGGGEGGGMGDIGRMFGNMGGGEGGDMGDMLKSMMGKMNMPKGARFDSNKMDQVQKQTTLKERLKARALAKKQEEVVKTLEEQALRIRKQKEYDEYMAANPNLMEELLNDAPNEKEKEVKDPNVLSASQKKRAKKKAKKQAQKGKVEESA